MVQIKLKTIAIDGLIVGIRWKLESNEMFGTLKSDYRPRTSFR